MSADAPAFPLGLSHLQRRLIADLFPSLTDRLRTDEAAARPRFVPDAAEILEEMR